MPLLSNGVRDLISRPVTPRLTYWCHRPTDGGLDGLGPGSCRPASPSREGCGGTRTVTTGPVASEPA